MHRNTPNSPNQDNAVTFITKLASGALLAEVLTPGLRLILYHDAARHVATNVGEPARANTRRGRGNLRKNREDPAPTVGIDGEDIKTIAPNKRRGTPRRYGLREF